MAVARAIGGALDNSKTRVIVNKSTVPVGSGNWVEMLVNQGLNARVPLRGRASRADAPQSQGFSRVPYLVTDLASAEMIKYSANAFLAMKISFANEIACLCEKV